MKQEINPKDTNRAIAFELWTKSPMPMVTFTKTFDVTRLRKVSRKRGMKFNMLLCWCIGKAASGIPEFYMLPQDGKLYRYDHMAINVIVDNIKGGLSFCDVAVCDDLEAFNANYLHLTDTIYRARQHRQSIQWHLQQSLRGVGPLPQRMVQDHPLPLFPVPPRPDGWFACCPFLRRVTKGDEYNIDLTT